MEKLFSPWRSKYIESFKPGVKKEDDKCLFCRVLEEKTDEKNLVLYRGKKAFIMMNLFPYNSGHLMIVPVIHAGKFREIDAETNSECLKLLQISCDILDDKIHPHGYNIGLNIGRTAGAGIDKHIHYHIVPRWEGDTNFMPVLSDVKVISQSMEEMYKMLFEKFKEINKTG